MQKSKIEWCDSTWNPVTGCLHGCEYCYARRIAARFGHHHHEDGTNHYLGEPMAYTPLGKDERIDPYPFSFDPTFHSYRLCEPCHHRGQNIFVCSMADLFGEWVPDGWIAKVLDACLDSPQNRYLFLTKNPSRYMELAALHLFSGIGTRRIIFQKCCVCSSRAGKPISWRRKKPEPIFATTARTTTAVCAVTAS